MYKNILSGEFTIFFFLLTVLEISISAQSAIIRELLFNLCYQCYNTQDKSTSLLHIRFLYVYRMDVN